MGDEADAIGWDFDVGGEVPCNCPPGKCYFDALVAHEKSLSVWEDAPYCRRLERKDRP